MTDLHSLLTRVEAATGPDRELDADIDVAMFGGETVWLTANYTMEQYPASRRPNSAFVGGIANEHVPLVTASLDAALALVGEMLPGSEFEMGSTSPPEGEGQFWAVVWARQKSKRISQIATANTLPLAVLSALLRALIAKQEVADA